MSNRKFISPVLIRSGEPTIFFSEPPQFSFRYHRSDMDGTTRTTTHYFQFTWKARTWQWSFCWRPDVTHHYWIREPYYKKTGKSWFLK